MRSKLRAIVAITLLTSCLGTVKASAEEASDSTSFWEKTKVTGQFNTTYNYNFNNPPVGAANNTGRVFDTQHNDFNFDLAEIAIETAVNDWSKFRLDLNYGENVAAVDGLKGGVIGADEFGIQQVYAELTAPIGKGLTFKVGHFVTPMGYEVIESAYNFNTSRSILFGFAIPFTHTGITMTYPWSDKFSTMVGVVNGWDLVGDNNKAKTFLGQMVYKPFDTLTLSLQGSFGAEQAAADGNYRGLIDFVGTWIPNDRWTVGLNYDVGKEEGVGGAGLINWHGGAAYVHYKPFEKVAFTVRGELFQDDGSRLGLPAAVAANATAIEGTGTVHVYLGDGWETRFEVRHDQLDHARAPAFTTNGTPRKFQDTVSAELVYAF